MNEIEESLKEMVEEFDDEEFERHIKLPPVDPKLIVEEKGGGWEDFLFGVLIGFVATLSVLVTIYLIKQGV